MKLTFIVLLLAAAGLAFGQTTAPADPFPTFPMPTGVIGTANFDQRGTPQITGSLGAIYPVSGSIGLYGISGAEFYPQKKVDAAGKPFVALMTNFQQEVHKEFYRAGRWSFLLGIGAGPSFSTSANSGFSVAFAGGGSADVIYQITPTFSAVFSPKFMYVTSVAGWDVIPRFGIKINIPSKK